MIVQPPSLSYYTMDVVENVHVTECSETPLLRTRRIHYKQNDINKIWDIVEGRDSISVLLFNTTRNVLILAEQFRPAVYYSSVPEESKQCGTIDTKKFPCNSGVTLELCGGWIEKNSTAQETAQFEVLCEFGYQVPLAGLKKIASARSGVGISSGRHTVFYAEVTDTMKRKDESNPFHSERCIRVVEKAISDIRCYMDLDDILSPPSFLLAITWFLTNIATSDQDTGTSC